MSVSSRAGTRFTRIGYLKTTVRHISWMPFEQPDPSLYAQPPSLLPKRPITAEAVTNAESSATPQTIVIGKIRTTSTPQTQEDPVSGKPVPTSVPASAMRTGPTPLSQVQKRTYSTSAAPKQPEEPANKDESQAKPTSDSKENKRNEKAQQPTDAADILPELHLRLPGHPATWPVDKPQYRAFIIHSSTWAIKKATKNGKRRQHST